MAWVAKINMLSTVEKERIYCLLIPPGLFRRFRIHPLLFCDEQGRRLVRFSCPKHDNTAIVEVKRSPEDMDPVFSIQISDSQDYTQLNWDFIITNNPDSPRFSIDVDEQGRDTLFGRAKRNISEEERAMRAGLAPGQVREGLRLMSETIRCLEYLARIFDIKSIALEALFYHNAIVYERYGFAYLKGFKRMERINQLFQDGGALQRLMNGATPFRQPGMERTVRGRSWAIHDGILDEIDDPVLDEPWFSPRMYLMVGRPRNLNTFPGGGY